VTLNLAPSAHHHILLNFNKCADPGLVADSAAIKVDESMDSNVTPEHDIVGNPAEFSRHNVLHPVA
jgi:hypothetical protein